MRDSFVAAEKNGTKIAVEIKSFTGPSEMPDLERALGQYLLYSHVLGEKEPGRALYLAVPETAFYELFERPEGERFVEQEHLHLIVFDPDTEAILRWIP